MQLVESWETVQKPGGVSAADSSLLQLRQFPRVSFKWKIGCGEEIQLDSVPVRFFFSFHKKEMHSISLKIHFSKSIYCLYNRNQ